MAGAWTRFHILRVLAEGPTYPYDLARRVAASTQGRVTLEAGNLHRRLQQLMTEGLIREAKAPSGGDPRRRYFGLTPAGSAQLAAELDAMREALRLSGEWAGERR